MINIISIIPVLITLIIAFIKKNVFIALILGVFTAALILTINTGDLLLGFDSIANVFSSDSTSKTIIFILLASAIMTVINKSGGVEGFIKYFTEDKKIVRGKISAQLVSFIIGLMIFVDGTSSIVVTAMVGKPFFKKYNISNEKLALISNTTGSGIAWLIPFGGACAFLTAILATTLSGMNVEANAFSIVVSSVRYQFYTITLLIIILISIVSKTEVKRSSLEKEKKFKYGTVIKNSDKIKAKNMIIPLLFLISSIMVILFATGNGDITKGDSASAVFSGGILTLIATAIFYAISGICDFNTYIDWCFEGMKNLFEISVILVLAFAFSDLMGQLNVAQFLASFANYLPSNFMIAGIFILSIIIGYTTGSSSASVILLIPIIIPVVYQMQLPIEFVLGAIVSGGVFGDQNSPISDSPILTASMTNISVIRHVRTQLPYTLTAASIALLGFIIIGFI